jgi:hypothetical protein
MTEKDLSEPDDNSPINLYGKSMDELRSLIFSTASRHAAHFGLGIRYLDAGDFELADHHFDQSLLYNGEDSIAWWIRAAIERLRGESAEESQFLLNAHFLAPLDPLLRAEGLLPQPQPNSALIQPIASRHGDLIQVACDLIECRLYQDAAKWIEACISIEDVPMLRILRAFVVLKHAGLEFECLDDLARAAAKPLAPPYPWRQIEEEAIAELLNRFPDHERLAQLAELLP